MRRQFDNGSPRCTGRLLRRLRRYFTGRLEAVHRLQIIPAQDDILTRLPAARKLGLGWVNWRSLRTSHAVWLKTAGADVDDAQGQMRHSRPSTVLDIYQQFVPEGQQRVVEKLNTLPRIK